MKTLTVPAIERSRPRPQTVPQLDPIRTEVWTITPDHAKVILSEYRYEHQRPISRATVKLYATDMREGTWNTGTHITFCVLGAQRYLIDGYHRLCAVIEAGHTTAFTVAFIPVQCFADIARHWAQMDNGKRRSGRDMVAVFEYTTITDLSKAWINSVQAAARFIMDGAQEANGAKRVMPSHEMTLFYLPYAEMYHAALSRKPYARNELGQSYLRRSVLAVALLTYRFAAPIDRNKVDAFWECVHGDGLEVGDPRRLAYEQIKFVNTGTGTRGKTSTPFDDFSYIGTCFTLWWDGERRKQKIRLPKHVEIRCVPPSSDWGISPKGA